MIEVSFYRNGFEINGHSQPLVCGEVSILAWACSNMVIKHDEDCDWYTSDHDNSNVGYTHLVFNAGNEQARWMVDMFKENLTVWSEHFGWLVNGYISIIERDETLLIPPDFKERKGIVASE